MSVYSPVYPLPSNLLARNVAAWFLVAVGLLAAFFMITIVAASLVVPYVGVDIVRIEGVWRLNRVDQNGTAYRSGMRTGDEVRAVNGLAPDAVANALDYIPVYRVEALDTAGSLDGRLHSTSTGEDVTSGVVQESISFAVLSASFWLVGFLCVLKRPQSKSALWLYLMSLTVALSPILALGAPRGWTQMRPWEAAVDIVAPWIALRFFLLFPFEKRIKLRGRDLTAIVYLPPALLLATYAVVGHRDADFYQWFRPLIMVNLAGGFAIALGSLVHSYHITSFGRAKQQIKIVALGAAAGILPFIALAVVPESLGLGYVIAPHFAAIGLGALPISLGYVIIKHRLLDVDRALGRVLSFGLALALLGIMYVLAAALLPGIRSRPDLGWIEVAVLTVLVIVAAVPLRSTAQRIIDTRLQKGRYDYERAAARILTDLAGHTELDELATMLVADVTDFLKTEGACLVLAGKAGTWGVAATAGRYDDHARQHVVVDWAHRLAEDSLFPNKAPAASGGALFIPLHRGAGRIGTLVLGDKASLRDFSVDDIYFLLIIQNQAALAIENASLLKEARMRAADLEGAYRQLRGYATSLEGSNRRLEQAYIDTVRTLVLAIESRNPYTKQHSERVALLARRIGAELGLGKDQLRNLEVAGLIHDIGKLGMPDSILLKPGPPDQEERADVEQHALRGVEIVQYLTFLEDVIPMIASHHEWYDGRGYPHGLAGDDIPLGARIIAVADAYDAMTSERPHRAACSATEACRRLREGAATQWDPRIVALVIRLMAG